LRTAGLAALAAFAAAVFPAAAPGFTPVGVITSPRVDEEPAATDGYLAFSRDVLGHPNLFTLWIRPDGSSPFRANPKGTAAFAGNFDGTTLVYSQASELGRSGDIKLYDVVTKTRSNPSGVNTRRHEGGPSISGDWITFVRARRSSLAYPRRLLLRSLTTSEQRELDFGGNAYLQNGEVAGDFAAWTKCPQVKHCSTWLYQISTESKTRLPNPQDKSQFAVSLTSDGTVYYAESSTILCSAKKVVRFFRQPLADPRELVATLSKGKDTGDTSPFVALDGSVDLYFDRFNATCEKADIYKIPIPPPGP
jgi:hypothetical protein